MVKIKGLPVHFIGVGVRVRVGAGEEKIGVCQKRTGSAKLLFPFDMIPTS